MFERSAELYDSFYSWKDYGGEAERIHELIQERRPGARALLDVACGTGKHLEHWRGRYDVEGLDVDERLLDVARRRNPGVTFHRADMATFELARRFDVVTCLFSSIGYMKTVEELERAVGNIARHLNRPGLLLVEPWLTPAEFEPGHLGALFVDEPELKAARINRSDARGATSFLYFEYLVGRPEEVRHFTETHELGLFTRAEYIEAFTKAGLEVDHDPVGLMGRGLYIALAP